MALEKKKRFASWGLPSLGSPQQNAMYVLAWSKTRFANKVFKLKVKGLRLQIIIPGVKIPSQALQKTQNMRLPFWESFPDPQNGGHRFASFIFTITTAPTPILEVGNRLPNVLHRRRASHFGLKQRNKDQSKQTTDTAQPGSTPTPNPPKQHHHRDFFLNNFWGVTEPVVFRGQGAPYWSPPVYTSSLATHLAAAYHSSISFFETVCAVPLRHSEILAWRWWDVPWCISSMEIWRHNCMAA